MSHPSPSSDRRERELALRRELEALGEDPPSETELALILDDDPEVQTVSRLVELASASDPTEPLSELELHRGWRTIEQRSTGKRNAEQAPAASRRWLFAAVGGLAAAACVLFIVLGPNGDDAGIDGPSREQVTEMSEQVHATLDALDDGKTDSQRAAELAADYQRRLAKRQEQDG